MQVAIHRCEECGTRLQILERFLGRTVRCTNCGAEFVATLPSQTVTRSDREETVIASCPGCGVRLKVKPESLDRKLRCPRCEHVFVVAAPASGAAPDVTRDEAKAEATEEPPSTPPAREDAPSAGAPPPPATDAPHAGSYSHVCTACGVTMQVHARYFGRTLRCTSCRNEFEAVPPPAGAVQTVSDRLAIELDRDPIAPEERARRRRWLAAGAVLAVLVGAALWWLGGDRQKGFASGLFTVSKARTEIGVLGRGDESTVTAALDREALEEMIAALEAGDEAGFDRLRSSPRCIELEAGTRVRVLERRKRAIEARVRVLEGPWSSRIVWVPIDWVR